MQRIILKYLENLCPIYIWLTLFIQAFIVGLAVQLILLPYAFPAWHAGHGLLVGGDWIGFHQLAVDLANRIANEGWQAWELRPSGQAPAGVAGAIYALTGIHEPWILLPLYAALYATGGLFLWLTVNLFLEDRRRSLWCLVPYIVFPSAVMLYSQPHKDAWQVAGFFCFVYCWTLLLRPATWRNLVLAGKVAILALLGAGLSWVVRPYCVEIMQGIGGVLAVALSFALLRASYKRKLVWSRALVLISLAWAMVVAFTPFTTFTPFANPLERPKVTNEKVTNELEGRNEQMMAWAKSPGSPSFLEQKFAGIAASRELLRQIKANGNIDDDVAFHSSRDILLYLPRAAEIGFLSPFPQHWFGSGSTSYNTFFRRIVVLEMVVLYLSELLLLWGIIRFWYRPEFWVVLISSVIMIMIYALTVPNIGGLYRYRWGYIMLLIALGLAVFLKSFAQYRVSAREKLASVSKNCLF